VSTAKVRLPRVLFLIAGGRAVSLLGDEVATLAIAFRAKEHYGHVGVAAILIANALPLVLLSAHAGFVVDRFRTKPVLVVTTTIQALLCVALAFSPVALLIPLVALLACGTAVAAPAWQALVPVMVPSEQLTSAFGTLQSTTTLAGLAGPALGGLLVSRFGFSWPLIIDAISFGVLVGVAVAMRVDRTPSGEHAARTKGDVTEGFRLTWADPVLRSLLVLIVVFIIALGAVNVVEIFFVTQSLHAGPAGYGLLGVSFGLGTVVMSALAGRIARRGIPATALFVGGCFLLCGALLGFSFARTLWIAALFSALVGVGNALVNVNVSVIVVTRTPESARGRVFSAVQGMVSSGQILSILLGAVLLTVLAPSTILLASALTSFGVLAVTMGPVLRGGATPTTVSDPAF